MIRSVKGLFIISVVLAILMIFNSFSYIEFTGGAEAKFSRTGTYLVTFLVVYNAGIYTQKFIQARKDR